jgi:hypothetical protein
MFRTQVVETIKTHTLCSTNFSPENHAIYEVWENIIQADRSQRTILYGACTLRDE